LPLAKFGLVQASRREHEDVLDAMQARLDPMPEPMGVRRQTVEHPFGTLKGKRCLGGTFRSARGRVMFEAHARASTHVDFRT
jgi:hypothetical protein